MRINVFGKGARNFRNLFKLIPLIILLCFLFKPGDALTSELGPSGGLTSSGKYGGDDFLIGFVPPPGFYYLNYTFFYSAHRFKGYGGDEVNEGPFKGFETEISGNIFRPIYVSDKKILGGDPVFDIALPLINKHIETEYFDDSVSGIGDICVGVFGLAWHKNIFHYLFSFDVFAPTGKYDKYDKVNIGNNHWIFNPLFTICAVFPNGLDFGVNLLYDFHTKNNDYLDPRTGKTTDYQTGQAFHLDYSIGYQIKKSWRAGIVGYYWKDTTDDKIGGKKIRDSRGQVFSIGPGIMFASGKITISLKTEFETAAKNRPQGSMTWLRILYSF
ncbi:MAG: transporter [Thermodesulfobacteriota bacterium]|nr:transporter [Thermodesulfobacteriota bacterium]